MNLKIVSFGIAKDIIGSKQMHITVDDVHTAGDLKSELTKRFPDFEKLVKFSFAINEEYQDDHFQLTDGDEVVVIPPVSGG
jgi:molybdopterin synthase sulfur carrier subunit